MQTGANADDQGCVAVSRPLVRELPGDLDTPTTVYLKLASAGRPAFMLESVSGGERIARYSFVGTDPVSAYVIRGSTLEIHRPGQVVVRKSLVEEDPLSALREEMSAFQVTPQAGLPRFTGGLVGYLAYDAVRFFEPRLRLLPHPLEPDAVFMLVDTVVAFDHAYGKILLITNVSQDAGPEELERANRRLDTLEQRLRGPLTLPAMNRDLPPSDALTRTTDQPEFCTSVEKAKELIRAGDIFQVVLSQRLSRTTSATPFSIYRALRRLNPSPYMVYLDLGLLTGDSPFQIIAASPEMHVRYEEGTAFLRPIAGTRPRGATAAKDQDLEQELLADPKERAEHVMLVDLARNDLGRVCEYGTVRVPERMTVERYSHVMHIVSQVEGRLRSGSDAYDLLRATFPAGTVSGAPKVRAMEIISQLEQMPRGIYAGAVGYISFDGSMDTCIAIRSLAMHGSTINVQAGAGIVADSIPEREYEETLSKARALIVAVEKAEEEDA